MKPPLGNANHEKFLGHLEASEEMRLKVARWFESRGYRVNVPPMSKAGSHEEWKDHRDGGDLEVIMRIEVKHLSYHFTCLKDWPHSPNFIVCAKHAWDQAKPKPYAFIYANPTGTHGAAVFGNSRRSWSVKRMKDRRYEGEQQDCYLVPMDKVLFFPFGKEPS